MRNAYMFRLQSVCAVVVTLVAIGADAAEPKSVYEATVDQSFPLKPGASFTLQNTNGSVDVATWDKPEVHIIAEKRMSLDSGGWWLARLIGLRQTRIETHADAQALFDQLAVEFSGDESRRSVMTRYPDSRDVNCSVNYRVTVPRATNVDLDTTNGSIHIAGVEGETAVSTTSGSVAVEDVNRRVHATTTNGRVNLQDIAGPVSAKTTNGSVSVRVASPLQDVEMRSVNGSVTLYVPAESTFAVTARTTNGSVSCDPPLSSVVEQTRKRVEGVVGTGGPHLELSTTNGSVRIVHGG